MEALTDGHLGPTFSVLIFVKTLVKKDTIIGSINRIIEPMLVIIGSTMEVIIGSTTEVIKIGLITKISTDPATAGEISEVIFHQEIIQNLAEIINIKNLVKNS